MTDDSERPEIRIGYGSRLDLDQVVRVARGEDARKAPEDRSRVSLSPEARLRTEESASWVARIVDGLKGAGSEEGPQAYYGINTGFGALAGRTALKSAYLTRLLSRNLLTSHSAGVGDYFEEEVVRAALLLRAHSISQGYSGVRPEVVEKLISVLNADIYPAVPCKGSLGASGDLAPLSHLALIISRVPDSDGRQEVELDQDSGEAFVSTPAGDLDEASEAFHHIDVHRWSSRQKLYRRVSGREVMDRVGGQIELTAKEGLAMNNGTNFSCAVASLTLHDAFNVLKHAELALAMSLEAICGFEDPFFRELHDVRGHAGAQQSARLVRRYVSGSGLLGSTRFVDPERTPPQDPYSVRCAPQVHGAVRDALTWIRSTVEIELNAATDNPLIFPTLERPYKAASGGNFHGEPLAFAMDFLKIIATEIASISERRVFLLTSYQRSGPGPNVDLPHFLTDWKADSEDPSLGLHSGLMIPQYTAASLVSECKTLAHPDSVDSIPSSANQEDHVSMSLNAARHARQIVDNAQAVVAIELLNAAQALSWRLKMDPQVPLGKGTAAAHHVIRTRIDYMEQDRVLYPDIREAIGMLRRGELVVAADEATAADPDR